MAIIPNLAFNFVQVSVVQVFTASFLDADGCKTGESRSGGIRTEDNDHRVQGKPVRFMGLLSVHVC
jgi:hypothetical protein